MLPICDRCGEEFICREPHNKLTDCIAAVQARLSYVNQEVTQLKKRLAKLIKREGN